jgi:CBS domain-containing protein
VTRQQTDRPVHEWDLARLEESGGLKNNYLKVEQYMETDVFTVHADESVDLVANMMEWEHIRYVPVEDLDHHLVGLVSQRGLLRLMASGAIGAGSASVAVADVMRPVARLITISPETTTVEAIRLMREKSIGCLPVVHDNRLIGVVTERDFMAIAYELLERKLQE